MKLFLSQSSQNNAVSGLPVTGISCFFFYFSQDAAVFVVQLTE